MTVNELCELAEFQKVELGNSLNEKIDRIIVSELMSDVLTDDEERGNIVLVTGLCTEQAIRTADMVDALVVIVTAGKKITTSMLRIAMEAGITILSTALRNYEVCKLLAGKL